MALNLPSSPPNTAAYVNSAVNTELSTNWFPLAGVTNGGNASAGNIGEYISSSVAAGSAVSLTSGSFVNITSISLTAGDWDVWGTIATSANASTVCSGLSGSISTTSATGGSVTSGAYVGIYVTFGTGEGQVIPVGTTRLSLSATTTVYLVCYSLFSVSTLAGYGFIGARRVR